MAKFKEGDRVTADGNAATVIKVHEVLSVKWDAGNNIFGNWPAAFFEHERPRKFKSGDYVRVVQTDPEFAGEVGFVFEDDGDDEEDMPYSVGFFDEFESENNFSASELIPWVPLVGERVIEAGVDDKEVGTVLASFVHGKARVLWDSFPLAQDWLISDLEPADEFDGDEFEIGDNVEFINPFLANPLKATVTHIEGETLGVEFPSNPGMTGFYHQDFFSKAA